MLVELFTRLVIKLGCHPFVLLDFFFNFLMVFLCGHENLALALLLRISVHDMFPEMGIYLKHHPVKTGNQYLFPCCSEKLDRFVLEP